MLWRKKPVYRTIWDEYESEKKAEEEQARREHMTLFELEQERNDRDRTKHKVVTAVIVVLVLAFILTAIVTRVRSDRERILSRSEDPFAQQTRYPSAWARNGDGQEG